MTTRFRPSRWLASLAVCSVLLLLAGAPPFVGPGLGAAIMQGFDVACHQIAERSFHIEGTPLALCHRCTGIVLGLVAGAFAAPLFVGGGFERLVRPALAIALLPMLLDWGGDAVGLWLNTPLSRVCTGFVFGLVAGIVFGRALSVIESAVSPDHARPAIALIPPPTASAHA